MSRRRPRAFTMSRRFDASGVSGTGRVLDGVVFGDGLTVVRWCVAGKPGSTEIFSSFDDFAAIHVASHPANATEITWLDAATRPWRLGGRVPRVPKAAATRPRTSNGTAGR